jgi:hypothetical protein
VKDSRLEWAFDNLRSKYSKNANRYIFPVTQAPGDFREQIAEHGLPDGTKLDPTISHVQVAARNYAGEAIMCKTLVDWWPGLDSWVTNDPVPNGDDDLYREDWEAPTGVGKAYVQEVDQWDYADDDERHQFSLRSPFPMVGQAFLLRMDPPLEGNEFVVAHKRDPLVMNVGFESVAVEAVPAIRQLGEDIVAYVHCAPPAISGTIAGSTCIDLALRFAGKAGYVIVANDPTDRLTDYIDNL